jgi:hypothetical protein
MKIFFPILAITTYAAVSLGQQPTSKQPFAVVISTDNSTVKIGSAIPIRIELTNTSNKDLNVSGGIDADTGMKSNHLFEIRGPDGKLLAKKLHKQSGPLTGDAVFGALKAGESSVHVEDISRAYDMSRPGRYVIQMSRPVPEDPRQLVKSNVLTVTITP